MMDEDWETEDFVNTTELTKLEKKTAKKHESDLQQAQNLLRIQSFLELDSEQEMKLYRIRSSSDCISKSMNISETVSPSLLTRYQLL